MADSRLCWNCGTAVSLPMDSDDVAICAPCDKQLNGPEPAPKALAILPPDEESSDERVGLIGEDVPATMRAATVVVIGTVLLVAFLAWIFQRP